LDQIQADVSYEMVCKGTVDYHHFQTNSKSEKKRMNKKQIKQ
jgi:hypothetical protein